MPDIIINGMDMPIKNGCTILTIWPDGTVNAAVYTKASWAHMQTGEMGRKKTIISVDADESMAIYMALDEYIEKHRREYGL